MQNLQRCLSCADSPRFGWPWLSRESTDSTDSPTTAGGQEGDNGGGGATVAERQRAAAAKRAAAARAAWPRDSRYSLAFRVSGFDAKGFDADEPEDTEQSAMARLRSWLWIRSLAPAAAVEEPTAVSQAYAGTPTLRSSVHWVQQPAAAAEAPAMSSLVLTPPKATLESSASRWVALLKSPWASNAERRSTITRWLATRHAGLHKQAMTAATLDRAAAMKV